MTQKPTAENPLLVVVGMCGSGKSSVCNYLKGKGWRVVYFGGITLKEVQARGLPVTPDNERFVREELRVNYGKGAYAQLLLPDIRKSLARGPTVVDGLYTWAEYTFLRHHVSTPMFVITVFTSISLRYARLRSRSVRPLSIDQAEARDFAEIEKLDKGVPIAMADFTLLNDGSQDDLFAAVDRLLEQEVSARTCEAERERR